MLCTYRTQSKLIVVGGVGDNLRTVKIKILKFLEVFNVQWLKKCPHVSQILKDSVIAQHILNIRPNAWWLT